MECSYGCGQTAKYQFKNGKWCCSFHFNSCPNIRLKNSKSNKNRKAWNKGLTNVYSFESIKKMSDSSKGSIPWNKNKTNVYSKETLKLMSLAKKGKPSSFKGKTMTKIQKYKLSQNKKLNIEKIQERYPFFSQIEEMRYNPNKPEEKEIQVHCKNHLCENSKEKGGWFTPKHTEISERIRQLEHPNGTEGSYFYCLQKCKDTCILYNLHSDPYDESELPYTQEEHDTWRSTVLEQDNYECQKCGSKENLHCHHIKPVKTHPHLALDPDNGIVLCKKCHYEIGHKDECNTINLANIKQSGCQLGGINYNGGEDNEKC